MPCRLSPNVQVRKESWGLLFYQPSRHKVCFVKSGDWLQTAHFDGSWTFKGIIDDITRRTGTPSEIIERSLHRLTDHLIKKRVITHEVC